MTKSCTKTPFCAKKIAQKSAIWAGLRKSRVTKIIRNCTIRLFSQAFHDILILGRDTFPAKFIKSPLNFDCVEIALYTLLHKSNDREATNKIVNQLILFDYSSDNP